MVGIGSGDIFRILKQPPRSYFAFLICGSNVGLVAERAKIVVKTLATNENDLFEVTRLDGNALAEDPSLLLDESLTLGLFGNDRIIWIAAGSKNFVPSLEALFRLKPRGCRLVIEAGALKNDSILKRLCLKESNVAVIECWPDSFDDIRNLINDEILASELSITAEALNLLASLLSSDRILSRSEIEKIKIYSYGHTSVDESDILAVISNASNLSFDQAVNAAFSGVSVENMKILWRVLDELDPSALLSFALGHALLLHRMIVEVENGRNIDDLIDRGQKLVGKNKGSVLKQIRLWAATDLLHQSDRISESILQLRREPWLAKDIVTRTLLSVAVSAVRKRT